MNRKKKKTTPKNGTASIKKKPLYLLGALLLILVSGVVVFQAMDWKKEMDIRMNGTQVKNLRGDIVEDFDSDGDVGVLKNTKKELKIKNVGNDNLFVRVMVFPEIINNQGIYLPANIVHEIDGKKSGQIKLNDQAQEWIDGEDGYYYYTDKLKPNEFTSNLFKSITIDDSVLSSNKQENQGNTEYRYYSYEKSQLKMMIKEETITSRELVFQEAWGMKNDKNEFKNEKLKEINQKLEPLIDQK